jgi:NAD(P)-dependent dehydrogenase (short-subunit alcohol dehydrogenase family)
VRLIDQVALITGGNTGIGEATAELFAAEGARVIATARDASRGAAVEARIRDQGGRIRFVSADVSRSNECARLVEDIQAHEGPVDILFNNAGTLEVHGSVLETSEEDWDFAIAANLKSVFLMTRAVLPGMLDRGGVIVNNASISSVIGNLGAAAYCASKGGVLQLTKSIAIDFAPRGVRANCVSPAAILTPTNTRQIEASPDPERVREDLLRQHPIGRLGAASDVARAVLFLASTDASFITGANLMVDGGYTAI